MRAKQPQSASSAIDIASELGDELRRWSDLWALPGLERRVTIELSQRMIASLGRCAPAQRRVRLNARLLGAPRALLLEVLCHELAHAAAWELYGPSIRPHGREWQDLMRRTGFPPRVRLPLPPGVLVEPPRRRRRRRYFYEHRCRRCSWSRMGRAAVWRWRCPACTAKGLAGALEIWRLAPR